MSKELLEENMRRLAEPFDPADLYWKPQSTNKDKTRALVAVYADPRAYADRLSEVFGPSGWRECYDWLVVPYRKTKKGYGGAPDTVVEGHKLIVTCTVTIESVGSHTSMGEALTDDENVATSAEAQAFKRACMKFGLGRYLYDFPKDQWCPYDDKTKKVTQPPAIPDWAMPPRKCETCGERIAAFKHGETVFAISQVIENGRQKYGKQLCANCQRAQAEANRKA